MPAEINILGHSCDVVRHGSLLKIALIRFLLNVLTSRGSPRSLRTILVKIFNAYRSLLEGGTIPVHVAESRTVFISKASDIDDNGRIIRSPDALRPLTLCNCDCKLLTSAICRGFIPGKRRTTFLRSRPRPWLMLRAFRKNQVSY